MKLSKLVLLGSFFVSISAHAVTNPCTKGTKYDEERKACVSHESIDPCAQFQNKEVPKVYFSNKRKRCEYCPEGRYDYKSQNCIK